MPAAAPLPLTSNPGSRLEVGFRRLLRKCEATAAGPEDCWRSDPVFHSYVETLQEQLADLTASSSAGVDPLVLHWYEEHVGALLKELTPPNLPAYCRPTSKLERLTSHTGQDVPSCNRGSELRSNLASAAAALSISAKAARQDAGPADSALKSRMDMHRNLQESLIDDMADLAKGLKSSTMAVEEHMKKRNALLDTADAGLTRSANTMAKNAALAGKVEMSSRSMTCYTFLVLFGVMAVLMGVAVFIKLTTIAGYRAAPPSNRVEL
mmetsp:Transcript_36271/g.102514  ORF Transcript_36271/g.102514 Transcript_36271/m.102514 type:complete len:266 (+) Transcript_36271:132-929(+)